MSGTSKDVMARQVAIREAMANNGLSGFTLMAFGRGVFTETPPIALRTRIPFRCYHAGEQLPKRPSNERQ